MTPSEMALRNNKMRHMLGVFRACHANRLLGQGHRLADVAEKCGYANPHRMKNSIKKFRKEFAPEYSQDVKSPAPVGAGNEADLNHQFKNSTKEENCQ